MLPGDLLQLLRCCAAALLGFSANVLLVNVSSRRLKKEVGLLVALATNVLFAGVLVIGQYSVLGQAFRPEMRAIAWFVVGGLLTSYLGRSRFFLSVCNIGPTRASSLQITNPVFAPSRPGCPGPVRHTGDTSARLCNDRGVGLRFPAEPAQVVLTERDASGQERAGPLSAGSHMHRMPIATEVSQRLPAQYFGAFCSRRNTASKLIARRHLVSLSDPPPTDA